MLGRDKFYAMKEKESKLRGIKSSWQNFHSKHKKKIVQIDIIEVVTFEQ